MIHGNHIKADHILFRFVPTQLVCDEKKKKSDGLGEWSECDRMRGKKQKKTGPSEVISTVENGSQFPKEERLHSTKRRAKMICGEKLMWAPKSGCLCGLPLRVR